MAYILTYWPIKAKNIAASLALEVSGATWELGPGPGSKGTGDLWNEWLEMKPNTPWGFLPNLKTPEGKTLGSELAILQCLGRKFPALAGESDEDFVISQELIHQTEELYQKMSKLCPTMMAPDKSPDAFKTFWEGADATTHSNQQGLQVYLDQFDKYATLCANGNDKYTTSGFTLGELKLYATLVLLDLVEPGFKFPPNVAAFMSRCNSDPRIRKVMDVTLKDTKQYFIAPPEPTG